MRLDLPPTLALLLPVDPELSADLASARRSRRIVRDVNERTFYGAIERGGWPVFNGVDLSARCRGRGTPTVAAGVRIPAGGVSCVAAAPESFPSRRLPRTSARTSRLSCTTGA